MATHAYTIHIHMHTPYTCIHHTHTHAYTIHMHTPYTYTCIHHTHAYYFISLESNYNYDGHKAEMYLAHLEKFARASHQVRL